MKIKNTNLNFRLVLTTVSLIIFALALVIIPVHAADTAAVTATVTIQNISVSVNDGTVAYGTLALNTSAGTNGTDTQTATNDGNVTVDFNIRGHDSAAWTLENTAGANQYVHRFCTASCATPTTNYSALEEDYDTLATNKAASQTQTFDLHISTPTSTSTHAQQNVNVTVQAALP